jgi:hypothetical protein
MRSPRIRRILSSPRASKSLVAIYDAWVTQKRAEKVLFRIFRSMLKWRCLSKDEF